VIYRGGR